MTDDEYRSTIDAEAVAQARHKPWPAPPHARRVHIDDRTLPQHMAHQRVTEDDENA